MTPQDVQLSKAQTEVERAKKQMAATIGALQYRLKPANLMHDAWEGVRGKSSDVADGAMTAVKDRPVTISGIVAAILIFFARAPLLNLLSSLFPARDKDEGAVTTRLADTHENYDITAPMVEPSRHEGVNA